MGPVAIVTDSTADFVGARPLTITVVPLTVHWGMDVLRDKIDITTSDFYLRLREDPVSPQTAAPPVGIFEELYRQLLATHETVISIHLAARLSGTYGVATAAAREIDPNRIVTIDSTTLSVGLGWLAVDAAEMAEAGEPASNIVSALEDALRRTRLVVALETLEFLKRGGRIGRAQAFLGGLLNLKPLIEVLDGEVRPLERVRSRGAAIRRLADLVAALGPMDRMAVVHGDCVADARSLRALIADLDASVGTVELGSVLGAHAGPGVVGVGCILAR